MKRNLSLLIYLLFCSISFNTHAQVSYYVDHNIGDDLNSGLNPSVPWKTIQKAFNSATPNSTVYIRGGVYFETPVVNVTGTPGNPITFRNYLNETVILDGTGSPDQSVINITSKSYLTIKNLAIRNLTKNNACGIYIENDQSTGISNLSFINLKISGINWTNDPNTLPSASDNAQPFIIYGRGTTQANTITNLLIDSCEMFNNITGFSEVMSLDGNIDGFEIKNNVIHHNTNIGIYAGGNYGECSVPSLDHVRNGIIENNICYKNVSFYATSGGLYADGAKNVIIKNNRSYCNGYGIEIGCEENGTTENITVADNLIYLNNDSGIAVGGYTTSTTGQVLNCTIRNNTFFLNDSLENGSGEFYITKASNCHFYNNIFYANSQNTLFSLENISPQTGNVYDYNCYYTFQNDPNAITINWLNSSYSSFSTYKSSTSQDVHSFFLNPLFQSISNTNLNFQLQQFSPCINAGDSSAILFSGETDFGYGPRICDNMIDLGAYERCSTHIDDQNAEPEIWIFPNPVNELLMVEHDKPGNLILTLVNMRGIEMLRKETKESKINLDLRSFPAGLYIVKMEYGGCVFTRKILKI